MKSRLLIVDDELNSQKITSYFLNSEDIEIFQAMNFDEALSHLLNKKSDYIILDWRLSDKVGGDLLSLIQTLRMQSNNFERISSGIILYTSVSFNELNFPNLKDFPLIGYISKRWPLSVQKKKLLKLVKNYKKGMVA